MRNRGFSESHAGRRPSAATVISLLCSPVFVQQNPTENYLVLKEVVNSAWRRDFMWVDFYIHIPLSTYQLLKCDFILIKRMSVADCPLDGGRLKPALGSEPNFNYFYGHFWDRMVVS